MSAKELKKRGFKFFKLLVSARAGSEKSKITWEFRGMSRAISFGSQWVKHILLDKMLKDHGKVTVSSAVSCFLELI